MIKQRVIIRLDEYKTFILCFPDSKERDDVFMSFSGVPAIHVKDLNCHCHNAVSLGYYQTKTKPIEKSVRIEEQKRVLAIYCRMMNENVSEYRIMQRLNR